MSISEIYLMQIKVRKYQNLLKIKYEIDKNNIPTGFKPGYITKNGNVIILAD